MKQDSQDVPSEWEQDIRLPRTELALITRQLAVMLEAGLSLRQSLEILSAGAANENSGVVLHKLLRSVEMGWKLSSAMSSFPRVFDRVFLAMVEVGEETGQLVRTLHNLANWLDSEEALIRQVRSALTYPTIVLGAASVLTIAFFVVIFPGFSESLQSIEKLPPLTLLLIGISNALRSPLFWLAGIVVGLGGIFFAGQALKAPKNRLLVWKALAQIPLITQILRDYSASRFASAMTILLQTGVDILKSFRLASMASGSPLVMALVDDGVLFLSHGGDLADFMRTQPEAYPSMMASLVMVGQESATMPEVFGKLQRSLTEDTEYRLEILTSLLEPILMTMVAVLVGLLVVGVAMPMYGLVNSAL